MAVQVSSQPEVGVDVGMGVADGGGVGVTEGDGVGVAVADGVGVAVTVGVGAIVGVGVDAVRKAFRTDSEMLSEPFP